MLKEAYHLLTKEYTLTLATTEKDFYAVKKLRAEIFSLKYNMPPSILESKGYLFSQDDKQSFIYLLKHIPTERYIGTVRNFFINAHTTQTLMPMQRDGNVKDINFSSYNLPICEISRMGLSNNLLKYQNFSTLKLRTYLSLALMIATRINAFLYQYSTIFSIMEPSLDRILKRQQAYFEQTGKPVDYYGTCIPYAINRKKLLEETEENVGQVTRYYLKQLCQNPEPFWQFIDNNPYLERSDIQLDRICQLFKEYGDDVDLELLLGEKEIITEV